MSQRTEFTGCKMLRPAVVVDVKNVNRREHLLDFGEK
jgi:hypothetical protein